MPATLTDEGTLGSRIAGRRIALGKTQKQLADAAGVSPRYISSIENDKAKPGLEVVSTIAQVMGVSLDSLVTG